MTWDDGEPTMGAVYTLKLEQLLGPARESYGAADLFVVSLNAGLTGFIVPLKLYSILTAGKPYVAAVEGRRALEAGRFGWLRRP